MHFPFLKLAGAALPVIGNGSFSAVLEWVLRAGYLFIFLGMIVEGPTITAAASFAATMGYFSLPIIFVMAIFGDIVGDFIWYALGYFGRQTIIKKYGHFFGATDEKMEKLKKLLEKHPGKIITAIKLSPLIPVPGLIIAGSTHISPKKFALIITYIILPKTVLFMSVGYFFGRAYEKISIYLNSGISAIGIILLAAFLIYYFYKKITGSISKRLTDV